LIGFETFAGSQIEAAAAELARLRVAVFREWPYLYDGGEAYERGYLDVYARCPGAAIILARDGTDVVGAATCMPLVEETDAVRAPFESRKQGKDRRFDLL
jgi:hypothetical protein